MRTVKEIQADYSNLCVRAGHLNYSIFALSIDLDLIHEQMKDLNIEGATAQKAEAEAPTTPATPATLELV